MFLGFAEGENMISNTAEWFVGKKWLPIWQIKPM